MRYGKRGHQTFDTYNTPLGKRDFYGYSYTDEREVFDEISFEFDGQGDFAVLALRCAALRR